MCSSGFPAFRARYQVEVSKGLLAFGGVVWRGKAPPACAMIRRLDLPWRPAPGGGVLATLLAPAAGAVAVTVEGWDDPAAAHLLPGGRAFVPLAGGAFIVAETATGEVLTFAAPAAPRHSHAVFHPRFAASPSLALLAPRALRAPARRVAYDLAAARARIEAALAAPALDTALGVAAEMLLAARGAPETRAGVTAVLAHCARYPLDRTPALGAFVAALTE